MNKKLLFSGPLLIIGIFFFLASINSGLFFFIADETTTIVAFFKFWLQIVFKRNILL